MDGFRKRKEREKSYLEKVVKETEKKNIRKKRKIRGVEGNPDSFERFGILHSNLQRL